MTLHIPETVHTTQAAQRLAGAFQTIAASRQEGDAGLNMRHLELLLHVHAEPMMRSRHYGFLMQTDKGRVHGLLANLAGLDHGKPRQVALVAKCEDPEKGTMVWKLNEAGEGVVRSLVGPSGA